MPQQTAGMTKRSYNRSADPFHRDHDWYLQRLLMRSNSIEEELESRLVVRDVELLEHTAIRTSDADAMCPEPDVDRHAKLATTPRHLSFLHSNIHQGMSNDRCRSRVTSTRRATCEPQSTIPADDERRGRKRRGRHFRRSGSPKRPLTP